MATRTPANRPTMADVAREASVSVTTVSYVLGGRGGSTAAARISDDTRQRVMDAVARTGYQIHLPARNLRRQRTDHVLLLIDRLSSPFSQRMANEISAVLADNGLRMSVVICSDHKQLETALDMVPRRIADGAIVVNASRPFAADILTRAANQGVPIVAVGSFDSGSYDVMTPLDEAPAVALAIDHLVERGRRRFAFIGHLADQSIPETRLSSARRQLAAHGLSLAESWVRDGARDRSTAHAAAIDLLSQSDPPDAIVSASDIGGIATIWAAMRCGFGVPDDLSVVGCGNIEECLLTVPTLSSAGPPSMDFSRIAFQMIDRLAHPTRPAEVHAAERWTFFPRESS